MPPPINIFANVDNFGLVAASAAFFGTYFVNKSRVRLEFNEYRKLFAAFNVVSVLGKMIECNQTIMSIKSY